MKFSVVVPTYNEEKYLGRLLESLKGPKKKFDFEVIVSDSNSNDKTREIAKKYGARVINGPKAGPAKGRNLGVKAAKNDFLIFINADEIADEQLFETLKKNIDREYAIYLVKLEPDNRTLLNIIFFWIYNIVNSFFVNYLPWFAIYPGEFIGVRKEVFEKVGGFNENFHLSEDRDFAIRCLKFGKPKFIPGTHVLVSTRRMEKWGWLKFILFHAYSHLYYTLFKKPIKQGYEKVR